MAIQSLAINPPTATITCQNGAQATQQFQAIATYADGTSGPVTATWGATNLAVGAVNGSGVFTAPGAQGGIVKISASANGPSATADLTVKLYLTTNPGNIDTATQTTLKQASNPAAAGTWSYPYDATVFPRGIGTPPLMWNGGGANDPIYVHLTSPTFELETFATNGPSRYTIDQATWDEFLNSTAGAASLHVSQLSGANATVLTDEKWSIADGSMRGTIYYWAINTGRVMRIKPGAAAPDDFIGPSVTCPSCHTVSANGSKLVMNEGGWPDETSISYDLLANGNAFSGYYSNGGGASQFALSAVSPDGSVVVENYAPLRGNIAQQSGAFDTTTGAKIAGSGLDSLQPWMPSFSPDGKLFTYLDGNTKDLRAFDWNAAAKTASNDRLIEAASNVPSANYLGFPTSTPDHSSVLYQRSTNMGSLGNPADLYIASVGTPGTEVPLDNLNGTSYPFSAGARDRHLNYEPTFAPIASGGYFWVVFHSRRTFGNLLTGASFQSEGNGTKQLWVAAIDATPTPGKDPSHPAFHLEGQDLTTLNMRGYWALDPCKGDGQGCQSGTECCGGFCQMATGMAMGTCQSNSGGSCSQAGDHCDMASDCCNAAAGVQCINNVCSVAPPA